jgi:hypothetical protein
MEADRIPGQNHIARYCKPTQVQDEQVAATAFMLRKGEKCLSVNWLEFLNRPNRENELTELRRIYSAKPLQVGAKGKIAILNVGEVCEKVRKESPDSRNLDILHDPEPNDPSHSGIYNLREDDELIAELIREAIRETYPARAQMQN